MIQNNAQEEAPSAAAQDPRHARCEIEISPKQTNPPCPPSSWQAPKDRWERQRRSIDRLISVIFQQQK